MHACRGVSGSLSFSMAMQRRAFIVSGRLPGRLSVVFRQVFPPKVSLLPEVPYGR